RLNPGNGVAQQMLAATPVAIERRKSVHRSKRDEDGTEPTRGVDRARIAALLREGDRLYRRGYPEDAVERWVTVLSMEADNAEALQNAIRVLDDLDYPDDAAELAWRALDAGTRHPFAYRRVIDHAVAVGDEEHAADLRLELVELPGVDDAVVLALVEAYKMERQWDAAYDLLVCALEHHPDSEALLMEMADFLIIRNRKMEAVSYINRIIVLNPLNMTARKRLAAAPPILTDHERGSVTLALREAVGVTMLFVVLAFQDAGLRLFGMDVMHAGGILLSLPGAYLLVTGTSSPQQNPVAGWLGASLDDTVANRPLMVRGEGDTIEEATRLPILPTSARVALAVCGGLMLGI
ncbi:MAG: tetratricopeptide repeat protein, partial [Chloroflexota bacterium]